MSLPHALLTALVEKPASGSELAARFDRSIGYFWHATHQQIYRELGRLEEAGFVHSEPVESTRGSKRAYHVLPAGRKELKRWIAEYEDPKPLRDELVLRLRAEAAIGPSGLAAQLQQHLALHKEKLELFRRIEERDFSEAEPSREKALQHLVLKAGIWKETFSLELTTEALRIISAEGPHDQAEEAAPKKRSSARKA